MWKSQVSWVEVRGKKVMGGNRKRGEVKNGKSRGREGRGDGVRGKRRKGIGEVKDDS